MRTARAVLATLTAVTLTACTTAVPGSPGSATRAENLLGDFRTIDACSLVEPRALTEFGSPTPTDVDSFEHCTIRMDLDESGGGSDTFLLVGGLGEVVPETREHYKPVRELPGGMWIGEYSSENDARRDGDAWCTRLLVFTDDVGLAVGVYPFEQPTPPRMCELADAAMEEVLRVIRAGAVEHQRYARRSLGRVDACALAPEKVLVGTELYASAIRRESPSGHYCHWEVGDRFDPDAGVQLSFAIGLPFEDRTVETGAEQTIGGRPSRVRKSSEANESRCAVETEHIPYERERAFVEVATVSAYGRRGETEQVCAGALAVAEAAWPKLPAK